MCIKWYKWKGWHVSQNLLELFRVLENDTIMCKANGSLATHARNYSMNKAIKMESQDSMEVWKPRIYNKTSSKENKRGMTHGEETIPLPYIVDCNQP